MLLHILYCCSEKKSFSNDNYVATECFIFLLFVFGMNEQYFPIHVTFLLLEFAHGTSGYSHTNLPEYSIVISHFWHSKNPLWCNMCGEKVRRSWSVSIDKFYKILHFIWWLEFLQKPLLMISPPVLSIATNVLFNKWVGALQFWKQPHDHQKMTCYKEKLWAMVNKKNFLI